MFRIMYPAQFFTPSSNLTSVWARIAFPGSKIEVFRFLYKIEKTDFLKSVQKGAEKYADDF